LTFAFSYAYRPRTQYCYPVIPEDVKDFSVMPLVQAAANARVVKIPAPLAGYWLGLLELEAAGRQ
jgi:hypothetical protein